MNTKVTDYKTKKINEFTGGTVGDFKDDKGILPNAFISPTGVYIGDYSLAWAYYNENMLVCRDMANGVAYKLNKPAKDYPLFPNYKETGEVDCDCLEGILAFGPIGECIFKIGDRLFDPKYIAVKEDYSKIQWNEFNEIRSKHVENEIKDLKNDQQILDIVKANPIKNFVPLNFRGTIVIERWDQAKQAAINLAIELNKK